MPGRRLALPVLVIAFLVVPGIAQAATVTVRIETKAGTIVPRTAATLTDTGVAPSGGLPGQTCAGNSVVGAVDAVTGGNWTGTWTDLSGWSIDRIKSTTALVPDGRKWIFLVDD